MWARVTDSDGLIGEDYIMLSRPNWNITFGNHPPVVSFATNAEQPNHYVVGQPVQFNAEATIDPDFDFLTYNWDFGDGFQSSNVITTHTYDCSLPEGFEVHLTVTDNWGASSTQIKNLKVPGGQTCVNAGSTQHSGDSTMFSQPIAHPPHYLNNAPGYSLSVGFLIQIFLLYFICIQRNQQ